MLKEDISAAMQLELWRFSLHFYVVLIGQETIKLIKEKYGTKYSLPSMNMACSVGDAVVKLSSYLQVGKISLCSKLLSQKELETI